MQCVFITQDLFFSSRVGSLAREGGHEVVVARTPEEAASRAPGAGLVILDLQRQGLEIETAVRQLRQTFPTAGLVAYGPHVAEAALREARDAGCDEVLPRSQFDRQIPQLFERYAHRSLDGCRERPVPHPGQDRAAE